MDSDEWMPLGKGRTGVDPEEWAAKAQSSVEEKLLALAKDCNCANLASGNDSGKTVVEKSGCCKLVKALT